MNNIKKIARNPFYYILFVLIVSISYLPTFTGGFILDDNPLIKNNKYIREPHSISSYFSQEDGIVDRKDTGRFHTGYYRPLINLTYSLDYLLWGIKAPGFRITNLILHLVSCIVLFHLITLLVKDREAAFWATILFAIHPVNTESVSWIISRNNILVTFFILISLYFYVNWWEGKNHISWVISILSFMFALFSKEFGIMLIPILFLYHRFLSMEKRNIYREFTSFLPFILVLTFYFFLRQSVTGALITPFDVNQIFHKIYFIPYIIVYNLRLIFIPYGLHYFYLSYPVSLLNWPAILSFFITAILLALILLNRHNRILLFSGFSFFLSLLPVLNIIPSASTSVTLIAMRWLYLPITFICIWLADSYIRLKKKSRLFPGTFLVILVLYLGSYTYILNENLWHDDYTFFKQEVLGFGNDFLAGDLAEKLFQKGEYREAEKYFKIAIEKYPFQAYHYINYSALLIGTGRYDMAKSQLQKAKPYPMTHHERGEWFNNMGMALFRSGREDEGLNYFRKAIIFAPEEAQFWANLGSVYGMMGNYKDSVNILQRGLDKLPNSLLLKTLLAKSYINLKDFRKAKGILEELPSRDRRENRDVLELMQLINQVSMSNRN